MDRSDLRQQEQQQHLDDSYDAGGSGDSYGDNIGQSTDQGEGSFFACPMHCDTCNKQCVQLAGHSGYHSDDEHVWGLPF